MNRCLKYDLEEIVSFTMKLMIIILLFIFISYIINTKFDSSLVLATVKNISPDKKAISIAQSSILIIALTLMINSFIWIMTNVTLRINMSITRRNIFKSILFNNILKSLIMSIFLGIILKSESLFIDKVISTNPKYIYLSNLGDIDILKTNLSFIILTNFIIILSIVSLWTVIAMLIKKFSYKIIFFFIAIQIILENEFFQGLKNIISNISINNIIDNIVNREIILLGIITILLKYLLTYLLIISLESKGEKI